MDRETFFARLTNEAATPDPRFIKKLQKQVIKSAGGGGFMGGNPTMLAAGIVTAAVAGVAGYALFGSNDPAPSSAPSVSVSKQVSQQDTDSGAENGSSTQADQNTKTPEESDVEDTSDTTNPQTSDDTSNDTTPPPTDSSSNSTPPAAQQDDIPFTVKFWNYAKGATPVIQDTTPEYVVTVGHTLDFDWGPDSPDPAIDEDLFVAQATATKYLDPGDYVINLNVNDGVRVFVNGVEVYERWTPYAGEIDQAEFTVGGDPETVIVIEYFEQIDEAVLKAEVVAL